jgi:hypothetical protein
MEGGAGRGAGRGWGWRGARGAASWWRARPQSLGPGLEAEAGRGAPQGIGGGRGRAHQCRSRRCRCRAARRPRGRARGRRGRGRGRPRPRPRCASSRCRCSRRRATRRCAPACGRSAPPDHTSRPPAASSGVDAKEGRGGVWGRGRGRLARGPCWVRRAGELGVRMAAAQLARRACGPRRPAERTEPSGGSFLKGWNSDSGAPPWLLLAGRGAGRR